MEVETYKIFPASPKPPLSLPVTIYDVFWLSFPPASQIFCYESATLSSKNFYDGVLDSLKRSLSLTLDHFPILAGHVVWPSDSPRPFFLYTPNDAVSLTVVQCSETYLFSTLTAQDATEATLARGCIAELHSSEAQAQVMTLKLTFFPNQGFVIGITCHHGVVDGLSMSMFMKAWSFLCNDAGASLPLSLVPHLERPEEDGNPEEGLYEKALERSTSRSPKSVKLPPSPALNPTLIRRKFVFTQKNADDLRRTVTAYFPDEEIMHLSPLVLVFSLAIVCLAKAKNTETDIIANTPGNYRGRIGLENYFGNCLIGASRELKAEAVKGYNGVAMVAKNVAEMMTELKKMSHTEALKKNFLTGKLNGPAIFIGIAGSPRFGLHKVNFGWGVPVKVFCTSIDGTNSIAVEAGEDDGDIQFDVVMEPDFMEEFRRLFANNLEK